jgi:hypothetical protein
MALSNNKMRPFTGAIHRLKHWAQVLAALCSACALAPGATAQVPWHLTAAEPAIVLAIPILSVQKQTTITLVVDIKGVELAALAKMPEHYVTVVISCGENLKPIKTSTISAYPMGAAGKFRLSLPQEEACFVAYAKTAVIKVALQVQLGEPNAAINLSGTIYQIQD